MKKTLKPQVSRLLGESTSQAGALLSRRGQLGDDFELRAWASEMLNPCPPELSNRVVGQVVYWVHKGFLAQSSLATMWGFGH